MADPATSRVPVPGPLHRLAITLLLLGGATGLIGAFLPWFVFDSASAHVHEEVRLIEGLLHGWLLPVPVCVVFAAEVLGFGAAMGLRVGIENRALIVSSFVLQ